MKERTLFQLYVLFVKGQTFSSPWFVKNREIERWWWLMRLILLSPQSWEKSLNIEGQDIVLAARCSPRRQGVLPNLFTNILDNFHIFHHPDQGSRDRATIEASFLHCPPNSAQPALCEEYCECSQNVTSWTGHMLWKGNRSEQSYEANIKFCYMYIQAVENSITENLKLWQVSRYPGIAPGQPALHLVTWNGGFWLVDCDHMTRLLASDWLTSCLLECPECQFLNIWHIPGPDDIYVRFLWVWKQVTVCLSRSFRRDN